MSTPKFDAYAEAYGGMHAKSVAASGEDPDYFHRYKMDCLERLGLRSTDRILDFGCGIGNLTEHLAGRYDVVHGFDPSARSLEVCQQRAPSAKLHEREADIPQTYFDAAVLSGVLHHVDKGQRQALLSRVRGALRPYGRVIIFEHNPLNPLTQKAVRDCPFDDDAVLLWPWELPSLLAASGFFRINLDFIVFFPRQLAPLRPLEPRLNRVVLGAQTMTVGHALARGFGGAGGRGNGRPTMEPETSPPPSPPEHEGDEAPDDLAGEPAEPAAEGHRVNPLRRFFLLEEELEQAEQDQFSDGEPGFVEMNEARALSEAAVNLASGQARLERSDGASSAELLLREAIYWGLAAHAARAGEPATEKDDAASLWAREQAREDGPLGHLSDERKAAVDATLARRPRNARLPSADRHAEVMALRRGLAELLNPLEEASSRAEAVRAKRLLRIVVSISVVVALVIGAVRLVPQLQRGPNLALRKPVTASSQIAGYSAASLTDGVTSTLGSHSENEERPWVQIDLGAPTKIARVVVYNRADFGEDRAVPLQIEVSNDGRSYSQVARRDAEFHIWDAKLNPTTTRFVRLKADKKTFLHLNEVTVHAN